MENDKHDWQISAEDSNTYPPIDFIKKNLDRRWPWAELYILTNADMDYVSQYAKFSGGRLRESEADFLSEAPTANILSYAVRVMKGRWPEAEEALLERAQSSSKIHDAESIIVYATHCLKGRWPEGEAAILEKGQMYAISKYAKHCMNGSWPEAEKALLERGNAGDLLHYAKFGRQGAWQEAEDILSRSPLLATDYAVFTRSRFNAFEEKITSGFFDPHREGSSIFWGTSEQIYDDYRSSLFWNCGVKTPTFSGLLENVESERSAPSSSKAALEERGDAHIPLSDRKDLGRSI